MANIQKVENISRRRLLSHVTKGALVLCGLGVGVVTINRGAVETWSVDDGLLEPGDLIFRRTISLEGLSVQAIDAVGRYSHVGLVVCHSADQQALVVHACPPEHQGDAGVRLEYASRFVSGTDVVDAGAMRLRIPLHQKHTMATWALAHLGWGFNADFQLNAPHVYYCTQLIRDAMIVAEVTPLPLLQRWGTPFGEFDVVPMAALLALPELCDIANAIRTVNFQE